MCDLCAIPLRPTRTTTTTGFPGPPGRTSTAHRRCARTQTSTRCPAPCWPNPLLSITDDLHDTHALYHDLSVDLIPRKPAGVCPGWRALPIDYFFHPLLDHLRTAL